MEGSFYNYSAKTLQGDEIKMDAYRGKVVLVVNTASNCVYTPEYEGLEKLYREYGEKGLVILGFPCNQFGNQEPGSDKEISEGCLAEFGITFPVFSKADVNGENTHPLFKYLKTCLPGCFSRRIKWNFTKFLVDSEGKPLRRYAPAMKPEMLAGDIERLLGIENP